MQMMMRMVVVLSILTVPAAAMAQSGGGTPSPVEKFHKLVRGGEPWTFFFIFSGTAYLTDGLLKPGVLRMALPVAAGVAAVQLSRGVASWKDVGISTLAYGIGGVAAGVPMAVFFGPNPGTLVRIAGWVATWWFGTKIEEWLRSSGPKKVYDAFTNGPAAGIAAKVAAVGE